MKKVARIADSLSWKSIIVYGGLLIWLVASAFPFLWTVLTSIKPLKAVFTMPPQWIFQPTLEAYHQLWFAGGEFPRYLLNTIIVVGSSVVISLAVGLPAGYALSRYSKKIGFVLLFLAFIFRAFPRILFVIPFYQMSRIIGLYDTKILLILVFVAVNQPFTIWMLRSFFMNIPESLEESAMIDGCSRFGAFVRVIIPLMGPAIITSGIFTFLLAYNNYLIPVSLSADRAVTMTVAIAQFGVSSVQGWTQAAAGGASIALPIVALILFFQKYIVKGLAAGAVKE